MATTLLKYTGQCPIRIDASVKEQASAVKAWKRKTSNKSGTDAKQEFMIPAELEAPFVDAFVEGEVREGMEPLMQSKGGQNWQRAFNDVITVCKCVNYDMPAMLFYPGQTSEVDADLAALLDAISGVFVPDPNSKAKPLTVELYDALEAKRIETIDKKQAKADAEAGVPVGYDEHLQGAPKPTVGYQTMDANGFLYKDGQPTGERVVTSAPPPVQAQAPATGLVPLTQEQVDAGLQQAPVPPQQQAPVQQQDTGGEAKPPVT